MNTESDAGEVDEWCKSDAWKVCVGSLPTRIAELDSACMKLKGLGRYRRLIDSYKKLHMALANVAATAS